VNRAVMQTRLDAATTVTDWRRWNMGAWRLAADAVAEVCCVTLWPATLGTPS
jgi:hypothetical protein